MQHRQGDERGRHVAHRVADGGVRERGSDEIEGQSGVGPLAKGARDRREKCDHAEQLGDADQRQKVVGIAEMADDRQRRLDA